MRVLPSAFTEFEEAVRAAVDPVALPSVAYGIARRGNTLLVGAAGLADKAGGKATPQTPYALASVTKPMTATAVMLLAERGLVELDAPVDRYLGGMRLDGKAGNPEAATVRRVLNHTAGLPLHHRFYYGDVNPERRHFKEVVARYGKTFTAPGERHVYSNLGYGLLDALVSNVSGAPYADSMEEAVFRPLGMAGASIGPSTGAAVGYGPDGRAYPPYDTDHPGGSAAFASVEDLLRFGNFHLSGGSPLLSPETRRAMQTPTLGYGLGWGVAERHGLRLVQHTGGMGGVSTILRLVPSHDLVLAVVANGEGGVPTRLADDALASLDGRFREGLREERSRNVPEAPREPLSAGIWSGTIETPEERLPLALEIGSEALARLDGREGLMENARLADGRLQGTFDGDLLTADLAGKRYRIRLDLTMREGDLAGAASAVTETRGRVGDALTFWTEVKRI